MKTFLAYIQRKKSLFLFCAFVAVAALYMWGIRPGVERKRQDVVEFSDASGSKVKLDFHLGEIEYIPGEDTQMLKLTATKTKPGFVYGDYESDTRNILFLAGDKESARWLFPDQNNVIHSAVKLSEQVETESSPGKEKLVKALYFVYSDKDSSGDGEITMHDRFTLGLSKANGEGFIAVLKDIDRLYYVWMQGDKVISILYRTGKSLRHARYSVVTLTKESEQEIAAIPGIEYRD